MKGKKVDSEFISEFICKSVSKGFDTNELIVNRAKQIVHDIDEQIKKVEKSKIIRSKLLDVINTFEKIQKDNKVNDEKYLSYYKILCPNICLEICKLLKNCNFNYKEIRKPEWSEYDFNFSIKQLAGFKIISKVGNMIFRGENFDEYMKFISKC